MYNLTIYSHSIIKRLQFHQKFPSMSEETSVTVGEAEAKDSKFTVSTIMYIVIYCKFQLFVTSINFYIVKFNCCRAASMA